MFVGGETAVYPFSHLVDEPVVNDDLGDLPVVVFYKRGVASALDRESIGGSRDVGTAAAFGRRVGTRALTFEEREGRSADEDTGSTWGITGRATAGPLRGTQLPAVRHDQQFWFALAAFVPDARIEK